MNERSLIDPDWRKKYAKKVISRESAIAKIPRGAKIFIGSACAEPQHLVEGLISQGANAADSEILHILTLGIAPYAEEKFQTLFRHNAFFIADNTRQAVLEGRADYTPVFLSELPDLFLTKKIRLDAALVQVSPPDRHGYVSLGVSVDVTRSAVENARYVIAEVNDQMPRTLGYSFLHVNQIDALVENSSPIITYSAPQPDEVALRLARIIALLVEDGSTIQIGIGALPNAVVPALMDKNDLGVHTEMFSDWLVDLVEAGVVTNQRKNIHRGKAVTSFCMGTKRLYDFIDNNPMVSFHPSEYTNDPFIIRQHDRMAAINSAMEIDLTGQVCSDSIGHRFYSGIGGQVDFIRGASRSKGGKAIIAIASTVRDGAKSTIVPFLAEGSGVVTTRGSVRYVVTEWGYVDLHGMTIRERVMALIGIAHPKFREWLLEEAKRLRYIYPDQKLPVSSEYPEDLEDWGVFRQKKIHFRPIHPTDERYLKDFFYSLSDESVYMRYFSHVRLMPHEKLQEEANLDFTNKLTIVAMTVDGETEEMVGVGQYGLDPATNGGEVSLSIRDNWQGMGIGRRLLGMLIEAGLRRGLAELTGYVLPANRKMLQLFLSFGFNSRYDSNEEAYILHLDMEEYRNRGQKPKVPASPTPIVKEE
ncbi:GNAT family N-acetyltransferase [bacterium]|nr:MAG: GNAT family N-acetyltransferase [bacterium]